MIFCNMYFFLFCWLKEINWNHIDLDCMWFFSGSMPHTNQQVAVYYCLNKQTGSCVQYVAEASTQKCFAVTTMPPSCADGKKRVISTIPVHSSFCSRCWGVSAPSSQVGALVWPCPQSSLPQRPTAVQIDNENTYSGATGWTTWKKMKSRISIAR